MAAHNESDKLDFAGQAVAEPRRADGSSGVRNVGHWQARCVGHDGREVSDSSVLLLLWSVHTATLALSVAWGG
jgi:hypothetical protein